MELADEAAEDERLETERTNSVLSAYLSQRCPAGAGLAAVTARPRARASHIDYCGASNRSAQLFLQRVLAPAEVRLDFGVVSLPEPTCELLPNVPGDSNIDPKMPPGIAEARKPLRIDPYPLRDSATLALRLFRRSHSTIELHCHRRLMQAISPRAHIPRHATLDCRLSPGSEH